MAQFLVGLISGIVVGVLGKYYGDKFTDQRKRREETAARLNAFRDCEKQMPALFDEMRTDLARNPLAREFILFHKHLVYTGRSDKPVLSYFFEDHPDLARMVKVLENNGFVEDITWNPIDRFQFTEGFVKLLMDTANQSH